MQLTPRYGGDPLIRLDGDPAAIATPAIRQRRRFVDALRALAPEQWACPSRCAGWTVRDVVVHLDSTNEFWSFSTQQGLAGEPTRFLATFDPVTGPAELVDAARDVPADEVLARFVASTERLADLWSSISGEGWTALAESPPGHMTVSAVAHHALWDSWVHERDVLLPLGLAPTDEEDEVAACLRYVAALAPAFALTNGTAQRGELEVTATRPDLRFVVAVDESVLVHAGAATAPDAVLSGEAVELTDALSVRRPLDADVPARSAWMVDGLRAVFDGPPSDRPVDDGSEIPV